MMKDYDLKMKNKSNKIEILKNIKLHISKIGQNFKGGLWNRNRLGEN